MSLPEQIQKQVDAANAIIEQHYGPEAGTPAAETPPAESGQTTETHVENVATSTPAEKPPQRADENDESYAQRWRSLQGIYNATAQKARDLESRNQQLEGLIQSLSVAPQQQTTQAPQQFLTEKDSAEYGSDMIDFATRAAKQEVAPLVGAIMALREEIAQLKGVTPVVNSLVANQRMSAEEKFFAKVAESVPDWSSINNDGRFHEWLLTSDPMTGIDRQTYLADAQRNFDSTRAVSIFNAWKQVPGVVSQVSQERARPNKAANELERQVAPGRTNAASAPVKEQATQWSTADIAKYYADVRTGKYKGREAERAELERDIFQAQREGRIQRSAA
jgi:hypothetical protein